MVLARHRVRRRPAIAACLFVLASTAAIAAQDESAPSQASMAAGASDLNLVYPLETLGYAYRDAGQCDQAIEVMARAIALEEKSNAGPSDIARGRINEAECNLLQREFAKAQVQLNEALKMAQSANDEANQARALADLGWLSAKQNQLPDAVGSFNEAIALFKSQSDADGVALAENNLGFVYMHTGQNSEAVAALSDALRLFKQANDLRGQQAAGTNLSVAYEQAGDRNGAAKAARDTPQNGQLCTRAFPLIFGSLHCAPAPLGGDEQAQEKVEKAKADLAQAEVRLSAAKVRYAELQAEEQAETARQAAESAQSTATASQAAPPENVSASSASSEPASMPTEQGQGGLPTANNGEPQVLPSPPPPPPTSSASSEPASMPAEQMQAVPEPAAVQASPPPPSPAQGLPDSPQSTSAAAVERYPNIEAPDSVAAGQDIAVQVSLTQEQIAPETQIVSGTQNGGKLQLQMAAGEQQWTLTVNLTAPGLEFARGSNTQDIVITRDGDSTIVAFYLRAKTIDGTTKQTRILATLWHDGTFLARIARPLTITAAAAPMRASAAPMAMRANAPAAPILQSQPAIRVGEAPMHPDLTIVESRIGNTLRLTFQSRYGFAEADIANPDDLHRWVNAHYAQMAARERGLTAVENTAQAESHDADYLNGFGSEFYDKYIPQQFKNMYWQLVDSLGAKFVAIQVLSDDPSLPWELLRPARADGSDRQDFLGLHYQIARWPLGQSGSRPPVQGIHVERLAVIAPTYTGDRSLPAASDELHVLERMSGFVQVPGSYDGVRQLASNLPEGIVHFAGHGAVLDKDGIATFVILLENGRQIEPATWQDLAGSKTATHPLYFFNACEVGQSQRFMNDVDGWAPALLGAGGAGYIGALWPVGDTTAAKFAEEFYARVLREIGPESSANVAQVLMETRKNVFASTQDPTALAYVFYGDPLLKLSR